MKTRRGAVSLSEEAFEAFYSSGFAVVYRATYAFSNSREIATEATQEAFVRAFARWRRLRNKHWAMGWVMTTALNHARKLQRETRSRLVKKEPHDASGPDDRVAERVDLLATLGSLPPRQKQAIVLHYIGGYRVTEVAELMNLSVGGVKSHLFKARAALRREMSERVPDAKESRG